MTIRRALCADIDVLMKIFSGARAFMAEHGNAGQWGDRYPSHALIEQDIQREQCYVCEENGHIFAVFVLMRTPEPTYAHIDGAWKDERPYGTLHRIASTGEKRGVTDELISWAFLETGNLRGDTHENNLPMQRAFERNGFERCGVVWMADGTPRIAYQKCK